MLRAQADERVRRAQSRLTLVRNPDYDPKTDSPAARQSLPDRFEFTVDPNVTDIVDRVAAGELEDENAAGLPPQALEQYATDPAKRARPPPRLGRPDAVPDA